MQLDLMCKIDFLRITQIKSLKKRKSTDVIKHATNEDSFYQKEGIGIQ